MLTGPSEAVVMAAFENILIPHSRAERAHGVFDTLREAKRISRHTPKNWVPFFAPSYSGKSTTIRLYMRKVVQEEISSGRFSESECKRFVEINQKKVISISLPSSGVSNKTVITLLLKSLGDPIPNKGNTQEQLQRLYHLIDYFSTELIIIDELQHLSSAMREYGRNSTKPATSIPYLIKTLLDNGHVPIVCIGVPPGDAYLMNNAEIRKRSYGKIDYSPIGPETPDMLDVFATYCGRLAIELVEAKLFIDEPDLISGWIPDCLVDVSGGTIGDATMLVRRACNIAARRRARTVEYRDLEEATDDAMAEGDCKLLQNPFRVRRLEYGHVPN